MLVDTLTSNSDNAQNAKSSEKLCRSSSDAIEALEIKFIYALSSNRTYECTITPKDECRILAFLYAMLLSIVKESHGEIPSCCDPMFLN